MGKVRDLTGMKFKRLSVLKIIGSDNTGKNKTFLCVCACGSETIVTGCNLVNGNTKSCGCITNFKDLTGQKFGKLTVIKRRKNNGRGDSMWECVCDCGNKIVARRDTLVKNKFRSCGCENESNIAIELKKHCKKNYSAITEYKIFRNPKTNYYLPYDIYLSNKNIFIEVHGKQHYEFTPYWHKTMENFQYCKNLDKMKRKYAKQNGTYIEIDLRKIKTVEQAIKFIDGFL